MQPWLLSNVIDKETSRVPEPLKEFIVLEKAGMKVGIIALVEKYNASFPPDYLG